LREADENFIKAANKQLSTYLDFHFEPYDSFTDKQSILNRDDLFEEFVFDGLFPKHLYRKNKKKCIDEALELREWIKDYSEHELNPLKEYILYKILIILDTFNKESDFILTEDEETQKEQTTHNESDSDDFYTLQDLKDFDFYLEHCFQDFDFYNAEEYFMLAIHNPDFEQETATYLDPYKELVPNDIVKKYEEVKELRFMLKSLMRDKVKLIKQNGTEYKDLQANVTQDKILILGISIIIEEGDTIIRPLPNNHVEEYVVLDSGCYERRYGIEAHYKLQVRKLTSLSDYTNSGTFTYINKYDDNSQTTINGRDNIRINNNSNDTSTNLNYTKVNSTVFDEIRTKLNEGQINDGERAELLSQVDDLEEAVDTPSFFSKYQKFITSAADHMTVIGPMIPALTQLIKMN